ncbi:hypothetical protein [Mycolicibacterium sp. CBMA 226]|uniref:hypothetical protein n=1 Tax=Mycolicibacterium sp. CBMA 226 TaxID=2606611 RepID=UPI0012DE0AB4|nr:hypothetical protein [Mycolicibacterium sp. CBMA 226]MUL78123.1 hypothetical protein [Mycolicibacterium sp. CBMA 226]
MSNKVRSILANWVVPLWPVTIVGAALGVAVGTLAIPPTSTYSATSVIAVEVPIGTNQLMTGVQPFSDSLPDYIGGELAYLESDGFRGTVATNYLHQPSPPNLSISRSGKSDLITLTADAHSAADARRAVEAAVSAYIDHVRQDNTSRYTAAVAAIDAVIPRMQQSLADSGVVAPTPELVALYTQRAALQVQLERAPGVIVVQPTTDNGSTASPPLGAIGGGALGGLIALGAALFWRSRNGTITSPSQLGDHLAPCPIIPLGKSEVDATIARSLYAVLPPPRAGRIVVIGASAHTGTQTVADYIALAASEHGPLTAVDLAGGAPDSVSADTADGTVIINAGPWASSPAATDAVDHANQIIIVARLAVDTRQSVAELCQALTQQSAPFCVVCVKG